MPKSSIVGDVINFRGLVYDPVNEMGVVAIFSKISEDIGLIIEEIRAGFPIRPGQGYGHGDQAARPGDGGGVLAGPKGVPCVGFSSGCGKE